MTGFLTEGLPSPVVAQEPDFEPTRDLRLADYIGRMQAVGIAIDTQKIASSPHLAAVESAAAGDLFYLEVLNHTARVVILESFAEDSDLDLHAQRVGLERFDGEQDEPLRERIRLAKKGKSAAGPDDYYKSRARNLDKRIKDVAVDAETRNSSDRVLILSVLTTDNGGIATPALIADLATSLNDLSFRSRNVTVEVIPAVITAKNIVATIYLYPQGIQPEDGSAALRAAFLKDQRLGFDLTRSYVEKYLHQAGVQRVELVGWSDAIASVNEAIAIGTVSLNYVRLSE